MGPTVSEHTFEIEGEKNRRMMDKQGAHIREALTKILWEEENK